jgi:hypothetical protein
MRNVFISLSDLSQIYIFRRNYFQNIENLFTLSLNATANHSAKLYDLKLVVESYDKDDSVDYNMGK